MISVNSCTAPRATASFPLLFQGLCLFLSPSDCSNYAGQSCTENRSACEQSQYLHSPHIFREHYQPHCTKRCHEDDVPQNQFRLHFVLHFVLTLTLLKSPQFRLDIAVGTIYPPKHATSTVARRWRSKAKARGAFRALLDPINVTGHQLSHDTPSQQAMGVLRPCYVQVRGTDRNTDHPL